MAKKGRKENVRAEDVEEGQLNTMRFFDLDQNITSGYAESFDYIIPIGTNVFFSDMTREVRVIISEARWGSDIWEQPHLLTPDYLQNSLAPVLKAVAELQHIIDDIKGQKSSLVRIDKISQHSPISVSLEGAGEAVTTIQEMVVPWRRDHAKKMAQLAEQEKLVQIERARAEVIAQHIQATKEKAEKDKLTAEARKILEEAEKLRLENEKKRLEIQRDKISLALEIIDRFSPNLEEVDRLGYLVRLLPQLDVLVQSNLETINFSTM